MLEPVTVGNKEMKLDPYRPLGLDISRSSTLVPLNFKLRPPRLEDKGTTRHCGSNRRLWSKSNY